MPGCEPRGVPVTQEPPALPFPAVPRRVSERRQVPGRIGAAREAAMPATGGESFKLRGGHARQACPLPALLAALEELGKKVAGEQAGAHPGRPRLTVDLDVMTLRERPAVLFAGKVLGQQDPPDLS